MWFKKNKWKFLIFLSFSFCAIPKIINSKISKSFLLLQIYTAGITPKLKKDNKQAGTKTMGNWNGFIKNKLSDVSKFLILNHTQNPQFIVTLTETLTAVVSQEIKITKNGLGQKLNGWNMEIVTRITSYSIHGL